MEQIYNKLVRNKIPEISKDRIEELADMFEIIKYLAKLENATLEEVNAIAEEKGSKRGTFEKKIFLEKVLRQ